VLNVENKATLPKIEAAYRNISIFYHPDKHATDKDAWTAQFQIPVTQ
jgi:curved DNA-binding protein CbpA